MVKRDLLNFDGIDRRDFEVILRLGCELKRKQKQGVPHALLAGKGLAMLFEKPSLRTRVTFETGMVQLGGHVVFLAPGEVQLGVRETPADCARSLSRWVDIIVVRTFAQATIEEMARYASVPVINALTDRFHPCQVLADCMTLIEHKGKLEGLKITFVGDGNNMVHSWVEAAEKIPFKFVVACPKGYEPDEEILKRAISRGARVSVTHSVKEAVRGADVIYTDVWASMGQEWDVATRLKDFAGYQVNHRMNDLIRPALYGSYQAIQPVVENQAQKIVADVVGPICESGDFFAKDREIPRPQRGDLLAVMSAGAYGFTMASNYNSHPKSPEVLVDGEKYYVVRERESFEDLIRGETIPSPLQ